jgi:hypothetical protein
VLVHDLKDQMLHYKYNYQVTIYDMMVNEYHVYHHIPIDSMQDLHQSIFVQYVHWLLIFVFFLPKKIRIIISQNLFFLTSSNNCVISIRNETVIIA